MTGQLSWAYGGAASATLTIALFGIVAMHHRDGTLIQVFGYLFAYQLLLDFVWLVMWWGALAENKTSESIHSSSAHGTYQMSNAGVDAAPRWANSTGLVLMLEVLGFMLRQPPCLIDRLTLILQFPHPSPHPAVSHRRFTVFQAGHRAFYRRHQP